MTVVLAVITSINDGCS